MTVSTKTTSEHRNFDKFSFLSTTSTFYGGNKSEVSQRRFVRSHARRVGAERRRQKVRSPSGSPRPLHLSSNPFSQHVGVFKVVLSAPKQEKVLKSKPPRQQTLATTKPAATTNAKVTSRKENATATSHQELPQFVPDRGWLDPFQSLPIAIGLQQKKLMYYYQSTLMKSFLAFDPHAELVASSATDSAWLNATLSLVALHRDLYLGNKISLESLFHRGEALRLVNERLADVAKQSANATIGTVALLANFDITVGASTNAMAHMNGLQKLVSLRGGIESLESNSLLQGLVLWSDLQHSSSSDGSHPRFRFACVSPKKALTQTCIQDSQTYFAHLRDPPAFDTKMEEIFHIVRHISDIKDTSTNHKTHPTEFSNCMYLAEYRLLTISEDCNPSRSLMRLGKPLRLALYLYLHLALRELPAASQAQQNLVKRLKNVLEEACSLDIHVLPTAELDLLMWILFMGWTASTGRADHGYYIEHIVKTSIVMGVSSLLEFRAMLKKVMWLRTYCYRQSELLWTEVERKILAISSTATLPVTK